MLGLDSPRFAKRKRTRIRKRTLHRSIEFQEVDRIGRLSQQILDRGPNWIKRRRRYSPTGSSRYRTPTPYPRADQSSRRDSDTGSILWKSTARSRADEIKVRRVPPTMSLLQLQGTSFQGPSDRINIWEEEEEAVVDNDDVDRSTDETLASNTQMMFISEALSDVGIMDMPSQVHAPSKTPHPVYQNVPQRKAVVVVHPSLALPEPLVAQVEEQTQQQQQQQQRPEQRQRAAPRFSYQGCYYSGPENAWALAHNNTTTAAKLPSSSGDQSVDLTPMPTTTANINNLDLDQTTPGPYIDTWLAGQAGLGIVNEISNKWEESDMEISPIIASSTEDEESISRNRKTETNAHDIRIHPRTRLELEFCLPGQKIATTTARAVSTSALAIAKTQEATTDHPPRGRTRHPQQPRHVSAHGLEHQHKRNLPPLQATAAANTAEDRGKVRHHHHHPTSIFPDPSMPSSRAPIMASSNNNTSGTRSVSEPMAASFSARGTGAAASAGPTMPPPAPPLRRWIRQSSGAAAFVPSIIPEEDAAAAASSSRSVGRGGGGDGAAPESWPAHARTASSTGRQRASEQGAACRTGGGDDDGRADAGPRGLRVREMVERVEAKGK